MSCRKGKSRAKWKPGRYICEKCGAVVKKKDQVCKPRRIEEGEKESSDKGKVSG